MIRAQTNSYRNKSCLARISELINDHSLKGCNKVKYIFKYDSQDEINSSLETIVNNGFTIEEGEEVIENVTYKTVLIIW